MKSLPNCQMYRFVKSSPSHRQAHVHHGQQEENAKPRVLSEEEHKISELLIVEQAVFGHNIHEESPMHREFIIQNVHELHDDTDPSKSTPFEQVLFCQIQCVRDTPQNRRTKKSSL